MTAFPTSDGVDAAIQQRQPEFRSWHVHGRQLLPRLVAWIELPEAPKDGKRDDELRSNVALLQDQVTFNIATALYKTSRNTQRHSR